MTLKLDSLLPEIIDAQDAGLTIGAIKDKFVGKSRAKRKERETELQERLAALIGGGAIWGPLRHKGTQYYFAAGRGPSIETASAVVVRLVLQSGTKLLSRPALEKKVTGTNRPFFLDAIKHAVSSRAIVELVCGVSRYYLHRDVAADYFGFETATSGVVIASPEPTAPAVPTLAFEELLPAYRRLKAEQGGLSAVKIFDLMKALNVPKDALHRLLLAEAKAGRIAMHHTTSVELSAEVVDAGIRLAGFPEPFVTIVVKNEQ